MKLIDTKWVDSTLGKGVWQKADIRQLRKLFIMPDSPDKFIEFGTELLDLIHQFFSERGGIHSSISIPDLAKMFSDINIPQNPHLLKDVLIEVKTKVIAHSVKVGNPYYIGHMTTAVPYFMILLEMIIAALNQNQIKIESAKSSTLVEREFIAWMHRLVFNRGARFYKSNIQNRDISLGNITSDGTMSNLTALLVARNKAFPADGNFPGIARAGMVEAMRHYGYDRAVIIVSKRGHYSIDKVARIIGIGEDSVIKIPVDTRNRMDIDALCRVCREIRDTNERGGPKTKIISIIGIAGTTETGNIDELKAIRKVANEYGAYFHVDAAWGGAVLLVSAFRYLLSGIEKADSVSIDAHKLMYTPVSMGITVFRDATDLNHIKHYSNYIIRPDSVDQGRFTVEGSRPFSVLKPWSTLKILGTSGFKVLFEHAFELTAMLRGIVDVHCNFEAMNQPELFIFNYRFVPKKAQEKIESIMKGFENHMGKSRERLLHELHRLEQINHLLNELNVEIHKVIREEDTSFVSRTMLDSPRYFGQNIVVLRAITINPLTTPEILKEIIHAQNRIGVKIYKAEFIHRLEKI